MSTKDYLIRENHELRSKLEFAQAWMRREVATSINRIQEQESRKNTRNAMKNIFEAEGLDILTRKVMSKFGTSIERAPRYTLERLIDAEIYWNTLQQYPQMDALPIIIAYQKILDAWIEERLVAPFRHREGSKKERGDPGTRNMNSYNGAGLPRTSQGLEQDIVNLIEKKYTLSIGRLYQLILTIKNNSSLGEVTNEFVMHLRNVGVLDIFLSDEFFILFQQLIEREIFSRKRHESKVTYSDARFVREILIDASKAKGMLEIIFSFE